MAGAAFLVPRPFLFHSCPPLFLPAVIFTRRFCGGVAGLSAYLFGGVVG